MLSLISLKNKLTKTKNNKDYLINEKYFLDKELLLKGIIYEENKLEEEFKDCEKTMDKFFLKNHTHSPYYKLFIEIEERIRDSSQDINHKVIDDNGNVDWGYLTRIQSSTELNEVFVDSFSINLNIKDVEKYHKILKEELKEVNENLGLYKSSWGWKVAINEKLDNLVSNIEFLKNNQIFKEHITFKVHFTIKFNIRSTNNIDIEKQFFKLENVNTKELLDVEFSSKDCLKFIELRDWGTFVKKDIKDFLEMRESGLDLGKQNHQLYLNTEDELAIDISNLDVN